MSEQGEPPMNPSTENNSNGGNEMGIFHWRDGWYFKRGADGTVVMRHDSKETHRPDAEALIPPNEWASIVASVCASGETAETYDAATRLHAGTLPQLRELLHRARFEGELPDELMDEVDEVLGIKAAGLDANMERFL